MPKLTGVFHHIAEPAGEGPGFALDIQSMDVDASAIHQIDDFNGKFAYVSGDAAVKHYPVRRSVQTLVARAISASQPTRKQGDTVLAGTIKTGIIAPGGETTGVTLNGIETQVDISQAQGHPGDIEMQPATVDGTFKLASRPVFSKIWVLEAVSVTPIGAAEQTGEAAEQTERQGYQTPA